MARTLSTFVIAQMLHVDPGSVANWIDQKLLRAYRTPGGHRRVMIEDLVAFLRLHKMPIPEELGTVPVRVVVVDDEPAVAQMIARAISDKHPDYEITEAHDGFAAGAQISTVKPEVVVLDLRMPGLDGYEVCKGIKSQEDTKHVEVIAITAYPSPEVEKRIKDCGARVCLTKPLEMETLLKEIDDCIF